MAQLVLDETGLLPHLNPGVMTAEELAWLRPVAPSMGMMLETTSHRLWAEKGEVHFGSPDKDPAVRLQVLEDAGRARVPLTTGILVGDWRDGQRTRGISGGPSRHPGPFRSPPGGDRAELPLQAGDGHAERRRPRVHEYAATVAAARLVMGADARIQVPPNLSDASELGLLLRAGADDWGGVSPLTADHVNPNGRGRRSSSWPS
jgi:Thiamine biosynthesis enzyme ThiH and related uncharacterized enzymes